MSNPSTGSGCNFRRARPDKKNWVLEEWSAGIDPRTRRQSPGAWRPIGYYGKIEDLLTYLVNR